jgi:hypothetical protein
VCRHVSSPLPVSPKIIMAPQIAPLKPVKQLEECMSNNWQDVPRDPIMDDD